MTAQAVGAVTALPTTARLTLHGGLGRAVFASQLDAGDTQFSLTTWCRYAITHCTKNGDNLLSFNLASFLI